MNNTSIGFNINNYRSKLYQHNHISNQPYDSKLMKTKVADTGTDPKGSLMEFINQDIIRPLERPKLSLYERNDSKQIDKWAIGTSKRCNNELFEPKKQQFTDTFYHKKIGNDDLYRKTFIKTDNIAIRQEPKSNSTNIDKKPKRLPVINPSYESQNRENQGYTNDVMYKTLNNRSGAFYNIIDLDSNYVSKKPVVKLFDTKAANMKKGICEFADLTRLYAPNYNNDYKNEFALNKNIFKLNTGIFSHLYDRSHRNGNMVAPFGTRDNKKASSVPIRNRFTMKNAQRRLNYNLKKEMIKKIN